jgi:predicted ribosome quality control (RQC) complex YloA/Tae2 family protein
MPGKSISSLDLYKLMGELSFLNGGFIRNVKSIKNTLYLLIFSQGEHWLKMVPGKYIAVTKEKPSDTIDFPFTSKIKSELKGKRVYLSMHGFDRIVEIDSGEAKLVIELFSNGNVILVKDQKIEQAMFSRDYGSRKVASGEGFVYPKAMVNVPEILYEEFYNILHNTDKESIVKAIAVDLGFGGLYAEEILFRAGIEKEIKPSAFEEDNVKKVYASVKELLGEAPKPNIINNEIISAVEIKHLTADRKYFDTISEALEEFFSETKVKKENRIETRAPAIKKTLDDYSSIVEYIEGNYDDISKMIKLSRDSTKTVDERGKLLLEGGWKSEGRFIYRIENPEIRIDILKPLRDSISNLYEKIKKLKRGLSIKVEAKIGPKRLKFRDVTTWYTKFRWFFTSGGNLVVIGRDNSQNTSLIDKHLEKNDIVLHADTFGSPFCLIKPKTSEKISESELKEAAVAVASYSSAWRAGAGNLDVYWVKPEQVTKTPPSGESLKKGAFYIEGKREYIKDVSLGLYIKINIYEEEYSLDISSYKPEGDFILIRPGNKPREEALKKIIKVISERLHVLIEKDRLNRLLPQGRTSIEKIHIAI